MRKWIGLIFTLTLVLESAGTVLGVKSGKGGWSGNKYVQIREVTPKKATKPTKTTKPSGKTDSSVKTSSSKGSDRSSGPSYRTGSGTHRYHRSARRPYRTRKHYRTAKVYSYKKQQPQTVTVRRPSTSKVPESLVLTGAVSSYDVGGRTIVMSSNNQLITVQVPRDVDVRMTGHGYIDISEIPRYANVKVKGIQTSADTVEARFVEVYGR